MKPKGRHFSTSKVILWAFGILLTGLLATEIIFFFSDPQLIDDGLRYKINKPFERDSILRIFFIGNYQERIPFHFFFIFVPLFAIFITIFRRATNRVEKFFSSAFIFVLILAIIFLNEYGDYSIWHKRYAERADAYLRLQIWAKMNTKQNALFLIDPSHEKGWEEFSERSSFGTFRQWLHTSIIVAGNESILSEGLRRTTLINTEIPEIILQFATGKAKSPSRYRLRSLIKNSYYTKTAEEFRQITSDNGIDYIILLKRHHPKKAIDLKLAYENDYYVVYQAK
jgi:hypothetical protein